ncbi:methyl-accepting chemotaxis protein [Cryptosporangium sp. NPDC048952]|uniref:methyl-accepting chemotaxis protein n=1 Tax=Cryptosporangium sp. NPDC048952 TaxID=3363961 RepID=UPI00372316BD
MRWTIKRKLVGMGAVALVGVAAMSGVQYYTGHQSSAALTEIADNNYPSVRLSLEMEVAKTGQADDLSSYVASGKTSHVTEWKADGAEYEKYLDEYGGLDNTAAEVEIVNDLRALETRYDTAAQQVIALVGQGNRARAAVVSDATLGPIEDQMFAGLTKLEDLNADFLAEENVHAKSQAQTALWFSLGLATLIAVVTLVVCALVVRSILSALARTSAVLSAVAANDLTRTVEDVGNDEIGEMNASLNTAMTSVRKLVGAAGESAHALAAAAEQLTASGVQIAHSAEETSAQAQAVVRAAEQVSMNVQTVAAGSEEMSAAIQQISESANEAATVAAEAVQAAESTNSTMHQLGDSSIEIGNVVKVITSIAEQTNLLALNATIEAARAGESGKGFAVVANEVKELAQETAKATEDISTRVQAIQADSQTAVSALDAIRDVIGRINDYQVTIAAAVEEQAATTGEMNRNVSGASEGVGEITANISGVAEAAEITGQGVTESAKATADLSRMSNDLQQLVSAFRV